MAMTKTAIENELRTRFTELLVNALGDLEIHRVGSGEISIPCLDVEGNEAYVNFKIVVPRGTRNPDHTMTPYDCYAAEAAYLADMEDKANKRKEAEERKAAKIAADSQRRAERAAKAKAKENAEA